MASNPAHLLRVGIINYENTLPWRHNLELPPALVDAVAWTHGNPAELNTAMQQHQLEVSVVSTAHYLQHAHQYQLLPTACIASVLQAESVFWVCQGNYASLEEALTHHATVYISSESATSVAVFEGLLHRWWPQRHRFERYTSKQGVATLNTHGNTFLIGDEALALLQHPNLHTHHTVFDLATLWHDWQQAQGWQPLPLVFAVWVAQRTLSPQQQALAVALIQHLQTHAEVNVPTCSAWLPQYQLPVERERYFQTSLCYALSLHDYEDAIQRLSDMISV